MAERDIFNIVFEIGVYWYGGWWSWLFGAVVIWSEYKVVLLIKISLNFSLLSAYCGELT